MSGADGAPALVLEGVGVSFGGLRAVDDVTISVGAGEIRGLIGPNGAGKSTLVNMASGELRRHDGRVLLTGRDVTRVRASSRVALGLARTFQHPQLSPRLTMRENLALARTVGTRRGIGAFDEDLASILADLGVTSWLDVAGSGVPYPVQKIVDTVRAVVTRPDVLLADEPAAGLTGEDRERLVEVLRFTRDRMGVTVVLIEHDVPLVFELCERISVLDSGKLIADGTAEHVRAHEQVVEAYLGVAS